MERAGRCSATVDSSTPPSRGCRRLRPRRPPCVTELAQVAGVECVGLGAAAGALGLEDVPWSGRVYGTRTFLHAATGTSAACGCRVGVPWEVVAVVAVKVLVVLWVRQPLDSC